jgi:hypothetical protein
MLLLIDKIYLYLWEPNYIWLWTLFVLFLRLRLKLLLLTVVSSSSKRIWSDLKNDWTPLLPSWLRLHRLLMNLSGNYLLSIRWNPFVSFPFQPRVKNYYDLISSLWWSIKSQGPTKCLNRFCSLFVIFFTNIISLMMMYFFKPGKNVCSYHFDFR